MTRTLWHRTMMGILLTVETVLRGAPVIQADERLNSLAGVVRNH